MLPTNRPLRSLTPREPIDDHRGATLLRFLEDLERHQAGQRRTNGTCRLDAGGDKIGDRLIDQLGRLVVALPQG